MRSNQQKSRSRGRGNNNNNRRNTNPLSRSYESNGPDVRVRGNAAHVAEKYVQLARDANQSGDSVAAENYLQHAEHYFRIVSAAQAQVQTQQLAQQAAHQSQQAAQQARQTEHKAAQGQKGPEAGEGLAKSGDDTKRVAADPKQRQPAGVARGDAEAVVSSPSGEDEETAQRPARRSRRRPRTQDRSEAEDSSTAISAGDPAGAPQPEAGELPAFVTSAGESSAAE
ncbi:MAG TPA: DUF4167 domain-containing protein [Devosia sp.]|nr:DUF4167 domain-containing protein [Devosia sp.]